MKQEQTPPTLTRDALQGVGLVIGDHTNGVPTLHPSSDAATLEVGRYSCFAEAVQLVLSGPQRSGWVASYPFDRLRNFPEAAADIPDATIPVGIRIGSDVRVETGATILSGVTIGDGAVIGSGSVVTRDVGTGITVAGNPARPHPR